MSTTSRFSSDVLGSGMKIVVLQAEGGFVITHVMADGKPKITIARSKADVLARVDRIISDCLLLTTEDAKKAN